MWLFLIHVFIVIILWIVFIIINYKRQYEFNDIRTNFCVLATVFSIVLFGHCVYIGGVHIAPEKQLLSLQTKRDAIVYEIDNDLLAGETLVDFNVNLAVDKWENANPWFNWYVCDIVDEIDLIDVE